MFPSFLTEGFPWFFLSSKANARVYDASQGTACTPFPQRDGVSLATGKRHIPPVCTEPFWAQNPDSQITKVYLSHN